MESLAVRVRRIFRKLQWEMLRGRPGRPERILTVPTENGLLSFSNMDLHNARGLFIQRAWERELISQSMAYLRGEGLLRPGGNVMIDAGANIGMICIAMLKQGYFREAIAVEPDAENFALLTRNIDQNGMRDRIRAVRCALADRSGEVELELSSFNFGDHRVRADTRQPALLEEERRAVGRVPSRTLDEVLEDEAPVDPDRVGLLWVDVQGFEGFLFQGARRLLARGVPVVSEFWPYGIRRSGMDEGAYAEVIRSRFARIVVVDGAPDRFEVRESSTVASLFATCPGQEFLQLILIPRTE